jgi:hypothetical protein
MDVRPLQQGRASQVYYRVVSVARAGNSSALNCHGSRPFPPSTQTRTLIPVLNVDDARHGGVKVGSNN